MLFSKGVQIINGKWGVKSITYLLYVDFVRRLVGLFIGSNLIKANRLVKKTRRMLERERLLKIARDANGCYILEETPYRFSVITRLDCSTAHFGADPGNACAVMVSNVSSRNRHRG